MARTAAVSPSARTGAGLDRAVLGFGGIHLDRHVFDGHVVGQSPESGRRDRADLQRPRRDLRGVMPGGDRLGRLR